MLGDPLDVGLRIIRSARPVDLWTTVDAVDVDGGLCIPRNVQSTHLRF